MKTYEQLLYRERLNRRMEKVREKSLMVILFICAFTATGYILYLNLIIGE